MILPPHFLLIFTFTVFWFIPSTCAKEATYAILVPKLLRPGLDFVLAVQFQSQDRVKVVAQIKKDDIPFAYSTMDYLGRGGLKALNIRIPHTATSGKYRLQFSAWRESVSSPNPNPMGAFLPGFSGGIRPNSGAGFAELSSPNKNAFVSVQNETELTFRDHTWSIFIQTDKPKYKPGDLVRFRVFAILPNLRPYMGSVDVSIFDAQGNQMKKLRNHRGNGGYASGVGMSSDQLQLADSPNLGRWKIKAQIQNQEEEAFFTVEKYVLPKFEVSIVLPEFITMLDDEMVIGVVKAVYTFGQGVDGIVQVKIRQGWRDGVSLQLDMVNGKAEFKMTMDDLKKMTSEWSWKEPRGGINYRVSANVTDEATGTSKSTTESFSLYKHREKVKFTSTPDVFKPGMKFVSYVKVTDQADKPLVGPRKHVNITYYFTHKEMDPVKSSMAEIPLSNNNLVSPNWLDLSIPYNTRWLRLFKLPDGRVNITWAREKSVDSKKKFIIKKVPQNGLVKLELDVPKDSLNINLEVAYGNQSSKYRSSHRASRAQSPSDSYIQISQVADQILPNGDAKKLRAGDVARFLIRSNEMTDSMFYLLLGRGTILGSGQVMAMASLGNGNNGSQRLLQIMLNTLMSPSVVVVVYYTRADGEVVADSLTLNVEGIFKNQVSIGFNKMSTLPGERANLMVKAAPNSLVAIKAVDKKLQLLQQNSNDVNTDSVMAALQRFSDSGSYWRCRYCYRDHWGPWPMSGGATTASQVFRDADIHVLTDGTVATFERDDIYPIAAGSSGGASTWANSGGSWTTTRSALDDMDVERREFSVGMNSGGPQFKSEKARKEFPETWLWTEEVTAPNGETIIQAQVPDSMTTWVASAFALHPIQGLGVAEQPAELLVSKPFFVSLQLPHSIVRGEEIALHVVVFNYEQFDSETMVVLAGNNTFQNIVYSKLSDGSVPLVNYNNNNQIRRIRVPKDGAKSVYFPIRATNVGTITIQVMAQTNVTADYVERVLVVEPEGLKKSYTISSILSPGSSSFPSSSSSSSTSFNSPAVSSVSKKIPINFPPEVIPDSASIVVSVIGDVMGGAADSLANLVRLPTGCGEQNLVNLAPSVFILRYLKITQRFAPTLTEKAVKYIKKGYQQELSYQRKDGSFSAWGNQDSSGSTFLTAMVVKTFGEALEFDSDIDPYVISNATNWILYQQNENGSFNEPGVVYMKKLQGGGSKKSGSITLTAYVASALMEILDLNALPKDVEHYRQFVRVLPVPATTTKPFLANIKPPESKSLIEATIESVKSAMSFLRLHADEVDDDAYAMSLLTYALHLDKEMFVLNGNVIQAPPQTSKDAKKMLDKLELKAKDLGDGRRYWPVREKFSSDWEPSWRDTKSSGPAVETAAYAILTYLKMDDNNLMTSNTKNQGIGLKKAFPVIQWLASQANELGGYKSTQDTVMALQALSAFSQRTFNPSLEVSVDLLASSDPANKFVHTFVVNSWNAVVLQMRELPSIPREIQLVAKGNGSVVAKVAVTYHLPEEKDKKSFVVDVDFKPSKKGMSKLKVCAKSMEGERGMTIFEIKFPSGFGLESDFNWKYDLRTFPLRSATNFEFSKSKAAVYFDKVDDVQSTCVYLDLERHSSVSKVKPVPIKIIDYYDPDFKSVVMYGLGGLEKESTLCDFLGGSLSGCTAPPPYVPWSPVNQPVGYTETK